MPRLVNATLGTSPYEHGLTSSVVRRFRARHSKKTPLRVAIIIKRKSGVRHEPILVLCFEEGELPPVRRGAKEFLDLGILATARELSSRESVVCPVPSMRVQSLRTQPPKFLAQEAGWTIAAPVRSQDVLDRKTPKSLRRGLSRSSEDVPRFSLSKRFRGLSSWGDPPPLRGNPNSPCKSRSMSILLNKAK